MTKINLIPDKIPEQIWERKHISDVILYVLGMYGSLKREEFINNREKGISNRIDKNTFHKWAKKLKTEGFIQVTHVQKNSLYSITNNGLNWLIQRLKQYKLDAESLNKIERKTSMGMIEQVTNFLTPLGIKNSEILIDFSPLIQHILPIHVSVDEFGIGIHGPQLKNMKYFSIFANALLPEYGAVKRTLVFLRRGGLFHD